MQQALIAALLLLAACASIVDRDRAAITTLILEDNERMRRAWQARDAAIIFPDDAAGDAVIAPDGRRISVADQRADLQRRMNMTVSIQEMAVEVVRIDVNGNDATALSRQRFVRTMRPPGSAAGRQRISTVVHRQHFRRDGGGWRTVGALEELEPKARWVDEPET